MEMFDLDVQVQETNVVVAAPMTAVGSCAFVCEPY
ncbi:FDLD family class I lanthipeptide [Tumebacillus avium]|nr:FDLD family class I lanthipeptide [Tumebacillus avium]